MPRCIGGFIEKLRHKSHEDSLVGHAVRLLVLLLNQPVFQLIVTVAVPVWLTFYDTGSLNRIRKLILCIGYTAIIIAIAAVNNYNSKKIREFPLFLFSSAYATAAIHTIAQKTLTQTKAIYETVYENKPPLSVIRRYHSMQSSGFAICEAAYNIFKDSGYGKHIYVTLYQKFQEGECEKCRMIAYANHRHDEPATYLDPYILEAKGTNSYYHNQIFCDSRNDIRVLLDGTTTAQSSRLMSCSGNGYKRAGTSCKDVPAYNLI